MKPPACGRCNFQGGSQLTENGAEILCLVDGRWHKESYSCKHWSEYAYHLSSQQRVQLAIARKNEEDAERRHRETLEHLVKREPPINITLTQTQHQMQSQNQTQTQQASPLPPQQELALWKRVGKWLLRHVVGILIAVIVVVISAWAVFKYGPPDKALETPNQVATIEFEDKRPFVDKAVLGDDLTKEYWNVYYFQVQIHNKSNESTIRVKHLKLTDLSQLEGGVFKPWENAEPVFLDWVATMPKEIPPQDKVLVPFARIFPPELQRITDKLLSGVIDTPQLRFTVLPGTWPRRMISHVPPGTHRFRITVFFEKVPPAEAELELAWSGKQREGIAAMVQDIKIRKL